MEIPDIIVVNKSDHPMTDTMIREVRGALSLAHHRVAGGCRFFAPKAARGRESKNLPQSGGTPGLHRA